MTVQELMERVGMLQTGRAIAYIKDGLEEINILAETHITTARIDIEKDKRFYELPNDMVKLLDVRCKNHLNSKDEYRSIPRAIGNPNNKDADGI
tara:strand:+ start:1360 stop:1641 length:282 start_codon:yes stop_codon:yes gene_type:complete